MTAIPPQIPNELVQALRSAGKVAVLTGAGVSAESGVPTFREAQIGLWAQYNPEELATPQAFQRDPRLVWEWYAWRRTLVAAASPNPGHIALAEMERRVPEFTLITQNVDGLHHLAGSRAVIELHGNIQRVKCLDECTPIEAWQETDDPPPRCPHCNAYLRPDVVWFGESLPQSALEAAWQAAQTSQIFLSVGTSSVVEPAASLPYLARRQGAVIVEVNPAPTPLTSQANFSLRGLAGVVLPALVAAAWPSQGANRS
jgi:NAD-dependent deacetylase